MENEYFRVLQLFLISSYPFFFIYCVFCGGFRLNINII